MHPGSAVCFENVSLHFRVPVEPLSGLKEYVVRAGWRRREHLNVWALRDVYLEVAAGEVLGIVGPNGAGKSTLLKVAAKVLHPTFGRVQVVGRTSALLELGAGFHPELTGRENAYLYGAIQGLSMAEIRSGLESIVSFAELDGFIDAPLRVYSSGMRSRLAFAVATFRRPDVLLVDEVLAVGDIRFQERCLTRILDFRRQGTTVLIVSHSPEGLAEICDRVLWLQEGRVLDVGPPERVIPKYLRHMSGEGQEDRPEMVEAKRFPGG